MPNGRMFDGRFDFQKPFVAFVVIVYLKFNQSNASPLLEYYVDGASVDLGDVNAISERSVMYHRDKKDWIKNLISETMESENIDDSQKTTLKNYLRYNANQFEDSDESNFWQLFEDGTIANDALVKDYSMKLATNGNKGCMLVDLKKHMMPWAYTNGSLRILDSSDKRFRAGSDSFIDVSYRIDATDESLAAEVSLRCRFHKGIIAFSAAYDGLTYVPYKTLIKVQDSLEFLTLKGNNFSSFRDDADHHRNVLIRKLNKDDDYRSHKHHHDGHDGHAGHGGHNGHEDFFSREQNIAWATFPQLPALKELDVSNCMIEYIATLAFRNLTNLRTLYLSHNKLLRITSDAFSDVPNLRYLDLSHMNSLGVLFNVPLIPVKHLVNLLVSMKIEQHAFKELKNLEYLDLSYTKITRNSAVAFTTVGEKLKYLSLCFTAFPMIGNAMFKNTALRGLDLSGNFYASYTITEDSFSVIAKTLEFLFFEQSSLKELSWLKKLENLVILNLNSNNINLLTLDTFSNLKNLQLLDLSSNHIGNWYSRVFTHNPLKIFNLRDNNINMLTSEMLMDFQDLDYLGIGDNNFICDCVLRDLVDIAAANNKEENCINNLFTDALDIVPEVSDLIDNVSYNGYMASVRKYGPMLTKSYANMRNLMTRHQIYNFHIVVDSFKHITEGVCPNTNQIVIYDKINGSTLKFQLLDYEDEHYWCFNETEKMNFFELNCDSRYFNDVITAEIRYITKYVVICVCTLIALTSLGVVVYLKRWHIHYYYSSLKSASLLAVAAQENFEKFSDMTEPDSNLMYDLFISYCQSDRQWVLEELMPNIENAGDLSICMHERDFQVGLTILDNIISCMDRSRCLMLVISSNFLLSHWCQFEMRLAQHRMFEASKEHLILVFLEDIPKRKRPKTLQYLMDVKTYIKWPSGKPSNAKWDERKVFWKRLRKSIKNISWDGP